jgi:hypothetical protein
METFDQTNVRRGCMNCHNSTRTRSDFVWVLNTHSFDPTGVGLLQDPAFRSLKALLEVHREDESQEMLRMMRAVPRAKQPARKRPPNR